jgi:predicted CXXCH cytochrome family protein
LRTKIAALLVALLACLLLPSAAFAWTHGNFSANTDACAGCHVAHAAAAPNLLKAGPTQTHFCFLCHGNGATSAPYDVEDGYTTVGSGVYQSTAGGFVRQFVDADSDYIIDNGELKAVTSRHNVWGFVYGDETGGVTDTTDKYYRIPGGSNQFGTNNYSSGGFVCASCHDPHDGGTTPTSGYITGSATSPNPRLLRRSITVQDATYTNLYVSFGVATVGTFTYGTPSVDSGVYRVTEYKSGSTNWCGACHNKFRETVVDGHASNLFGMYRHPTKAHIITNPKNTSIISGTPPEGVGTPGFAKGFVACLSCHRAHSTVATIQGWATAWPRDAADPAGGAQGTTSALLRMNNRGICWNCHDAALYNCWNDTSIGQCSLCH